MTALIVFFTTISQIIDYKLLVGYALSEMSIFSWPDATKSCPSCSGLVDGAGPCRVVTMCPSGKEIVKYRHLLTRWIYVPTHRFRKRYDLNGHVNVPPLTQRWQATLGSNLVNTFCKLALAAKPSEHTVRLTTLMLLAMLMLYNGYLFWYSLYQNTLPDEAVWSMLYVWNSLSKHKRTNTIRTILTWKLSYQY